MDRTQSSIEISLVVGPTGGEGSRDLPAKAGTRLGALDPEATGGQESRHTVTSAARGGQQGQTNVFSATTDGEEGGGSVPSAARQGPR